MNHNTLGKAQKYFQGRSIVYLSTIISSILILILIIPIGNAQSHWIFKLIGRFHPLLVHLPIGFLIGLFVLEAVNILNPSLHLRAACGILLWLTVFLSLPTILAGKLLAEIGSYGNQVLDLHKWLGFATGLLSIWLLVLRHFTDPSKSGAVTRYHFALFINVIILGLTGHYGGTLTHGSNYLTEILPDEIRSVLGDDPYATRGLASMDKSSIETVLSLYDFEKNIQPITQNYCSGCHNEEKQKGGLRLDNIDPDLIHGTDAEKWRTMLDMVNNGEMPPKEEKQLPAEELEMMTNWITASIHQAVNIRKANKNPVMRRLTKDQYTNTLNSLLNVSVRFGDVLPDDAKSEMGFSNNGEILQVSPLHLEYYQQIAREALSKAIAPEEKPPVTCYRIVFGKEIGKDQPSAMIGGYQSDPINSDDFVVEILNEEGQPKVGLDSAEEARLREIKMNIGVGMRGSDPDRYEVVDEGIILYSALPHKEVTPKSWQGPSPNLKLLIRNYYKTEGDFEFRVNASKGYQWYTQKVGFISLRNQEPAENSEDQIILKAVSSERTKNLALKNGSLVPSEVTEPSRALFKFEAPNDGYYQIDFAHPYIAEDAMPSLGLRIDRHRMQERLHLDKSLQDHEQILSPVTLAYLKKGQHILEIGGRFFVGFNRVIITPFDENHPLAIQLKGEAEQSREKYENDIPVIRTFAGARTDDGVDYKTFDKYRKVDVELGNFETFTFKGRLENLPIPMIDTVETEILANIMVIGLWNDFLVKDNQDSGPPLLIKEIEFEAPYYPVWPPESHTSIFFNSDGYENEDTYTRAVIERFVKNAFRRPAQKEKIARYMRFWRGIRDEYKRYEDGVKEVLIAVLCSPNFIYLAETQENSEESEYFLASRLSYFLWNSPPDMELLDLAEKGKLDRKRQLRAQLKRMLLGEKSKNMVSAFSKEWLRIDRLESMSTNVNQYPSFTRFVKKDMTFETYSFINHVLKNNLSIFNFIDSDFALLNQNLAEFYGIDSVKGNHFRPVLVSGEMKRGGLLSQGSFLNGHSDGTQAHPIKRAVWLKSRILGDRPPDPPPNVPELDPETPGFEDLTLKEQLFIHRDKESCMDCHKKIDPYGIVFENYDAVGRFQKEAKGRSIDVKTTLPDGKEIEGINEIKSYLINEKGDDFARALIKFIFAYALGRDISFVDEREIESILNKVRSDEYRFQSVFEHIVLSDSFRGKN